ncbi:trypsin-like peptidase domain-containing protein [Lachnospiraceae bacterium 46-15]
MMDGRNFKVRYHGIKISSLEDFARLRGGCSRGMKDVYFLRAVGTYPGLAEDIKKMDNLLTGQMNAGVCRYIRINALPLPSGSEEISAYAGCYDKWVKNGKKRIDMPEGKEEFQQAAGQALTEALALFRKAAPNATPTIERNFAVKLLYWFDKICAGLARQWRLEASIKVVLPNISKMHEYLFSYFLTQLGIDVLLLQCSIDIEEKLECLNLSKRLDLGAICGFAIPQYNVSGCCLETVADAGNMRNPGKVQTGNSGASAAYGQNVRTSGNVEMPQMAQTSDARRAHEEHGVILEARPVVHLPERRRKSRASGTSGSGRLPESGNPIGTSGDRKQVSSARSGTAAQEFSGQPRTAGSIACGSQPEAALRRELEFEELALLASSVVMIVIHDQSGEIAGTGSGIMVGKDGYILTNNHVASGGVFYDIRIEEDDQVYTTDELIKYNPVLDLALLRIQRRLKPIPVYGGEKHLVRGQKVVAIGSPLGLFNSVSDGIISGFRSVDGVDMIQFTAPISHGSSGGAVLNMYGEIIGISTAGIDRGQNINLAVGYENIRQFVRGFV